MFRTLAAVLAVLAHATVTGCASSAHPAKGPDSLASQIPTVRVAEAPPSDFELDFDSREGAAAHRFTRDAELTGSLHVASPTRTAE